MASTIEKGAGFQGRLMGSLALLNRPMLGLRLYQWLWVLLCVLGALATAAPRVLSQPLVYYADAQTRFDTARYGGIYDAVAPGATGLSVAIGDATEVLRQRALAGADVRFGRPDYTVQYLPQGPGVILVRGVAPTAAEARALADAGAEELARQVRAAGGREILRNLLGWELWLAMEPEGMAAPAPFDALLREIIRTQAFPMSRELEPFSTKRTLDDLPREELSDVARALEARYDLWRFAINTRNATLDARCGTAGVTAEAARQAALAACVQTNAPAAMELAEREREIARLWAIEAALDYVVRVRGAAFDPATPSAAHMLPAALPAAPEPRAIPQLIGLAALLGLALGSVGVAIDRSAGVTAKVVEIWGYRELIRNLVLREPVIRAAPSATCGRSWRPWG
jgi:lipopolysaccharide transport system permease protein